jgi:hypothetical protein
MAETEVTAPKLNRDDRSNPTLNQDTNFKVDKQLPNNQEVSFVPDQSKINTDYLENLLDIPGENIKGNLKDKVGPQLQEPAAQYMNGTENLTIAGTSSENTEVNYQNQLGGGNIMNKIQNVESSFIPTSSVSFTTIATDTVDSKNIAAGFPLNSGNVQQLTQTSCNQDSSNTSHLFTRTANVLHQNNQEQMNNSLKLICDYGSDSDIDDIIEIHSKPEVITVGPSENEKSFLNDYRTAQVLFSEDSDDSSESSDEKSDSDSSTGSSSSSSSSTSSSSNCSSSVATENASALRRYVYIFIKEKFMANQGN